MCRILWEVGSCRLTVARGEVLEALNGLRHLEDCQDRRKIGGVCAAQDLLGYTGFAVSDFVVEQRKHSIQIGHKMELTAGIGKRQVAPTAAS